MARNLNGWIRTERDLVISDIAQRSSETLHVWLILLSLANYDEAKSYVSGQAQKIQPGQLVTGVAELMKLSRLSEATVKGALKYLKLTGRITDASNNKGRVISIVNWSRYQSDHRQNDRQLTDNSPADDRQIADNSPTDNRQITPSEQGTLNPEPEPVTRNTQQGSFFQEPPKAPPKPKKTKPVVSPEIKAIRDEVHIAYEESISERWKTKVVFNATVNGQIAKLVDRLGQDTAEVVRFYVKHNDGFYVKSLHSIGLCLRDAEALHGQWQRGTAVTSSQVREFEKSQTYHDKIKYIKENGI